MWLDDEYGIRKLNTVPNTVVDIGANIGLFSLWVWCHFPDANIYTLEPNPRVLPYLIKNLAATHAHIRRVGVSCKPGRANMKDTSDSRLASTTLRKEGEIEMISLSQIVKDVGEKIDLLKMDCERAEWDIFKDQNAFETIQTVRMEYHLDDLHSLESLKEITTGLGYRMTHHSPNRRFGIAWFEKYV